MKLSVLFSIIGTLLGSNSVVTTIINSRNDYLLFSNNDTNINSWYKNVKTLINEQLEVVQDPNLTNEYRLNEFIRLQNEIDVLVTKIKNLQIQIFQDLSINKVNKLKYLNDWKTKLKTIMTQVKHNRLIISNLLILGNYEREQMLIIISNMIMNLDKYIMSLNDEEEINEEEDFNQVTIKVKKFFEIEYDWNFTANHTQANVINKINQELKNYLGNDSTIVQVKLWNYFDENKNLSSGTQKIYLMIYINNKLINDQINNSITIKLKNIGLSDFEIMTKVKLLFSQLFSFEQHFFNN